MPGRPSELFDSHVHLTDERFAGETDQVVSRAREAGITSMVTVASNAGDAAEARALARRCGIHSTAGIHPHSASNWAADEMDAVRALLAQPEVVAVGETGLDFHYDNSPRAIQRESFEAHLDLARDTGLPLVVHSRAADADMIEVLHHRGSSVRGVLHCFTGGDDLFDAGLAADWFFSFGGMVTFKSFAGQAQLRRVPWDRLMLETDAPYLAPVPMRGRRNEPAFLTHTCAAVALVRGATPEETARRTTRTARAFYGLG
ncbi:MAG: TatD family hydrolase [Gemmatimonadota bacterium]|nr:TatD family hydrolase [Gemmatimonadota bacterium]